MIPAELYDFEIQSERWRQVTLPTAKLENEHKKLYRKFYKIIQVYLKLKLLSIKEGEINEATLTTLKPAIRKQIKAILQDISNWEKELDEKLSKLAEEVKEWMEKIRKELLDRYLLNESTYDYYFPNFSIISDVYKVDQAINYLLLLESAEQANTKQKKIAARARKLLERIVDNFYSDKMKQLKMFELNKFYINWFK